MEKVECPICGRLFAKSIIDAHADRCLDETDIDDAEFTSDVTFSSDSKRPRLEQDAESTFSFPPRCSGPALCDLNSPFVKTAGTSVGLVPLTDRPSSSQTPAQNAQSAGLCLSPNQLSAPNVQPTSVNTSASPRGSANSTNLWGIFTGPQKSVQLKGSKASKGSVKPTAASAALASTSHSDVQSGNLVKDIRRTDVSDTVQSAVNESRCASGSVSYNSPVKLSSQSSTMSSSVPLAERMRPTMLEDFVGQGHLVGSQRPLRSLLESTTVSSMILWGPPGCGKVTASSFMHLP